MRESKAELVDRLRREGRFAAFKKRREELKAEAIPAKQAWYQAAAEFPPPTAPPSVTAGMAVDLHALRDKPKVPVVSAAAWAFEHLDANWVTPVDAPSAGAWSLLHWARSSMAARSEFYRTFVAKLVPALDEATRHAESDGPSDETIEEIVRRASGRSGVSALPG